MVAIRIFEGAFIDRWLLSPGHFAEYNWSNGHDKEVSANSSD